MTCKCQSCGEYYKLDLIIPDDLWEQIKPAEKAEGAGLLCGSCIMKKVEAICDYAAWLLEPRGGER